MTRSVFFGDSLEIKFPTFTRGVPHLVIKTVSRLGESIKEGSLMLLKERIPGSIFVSIKLTLHSEHIYGERLHDIAHSLNINRVFVSLKVLQIWQLLPSQQSEQPTCAGHSPVTL